MACTFVMYFIACTLIILTRIYRFVTYQVMTFGEENTTEINFSLPMKYCAHVSTHFAVFPRHFVRY